MGKVLVVEDELKLAAALRDVLEAEQYAVSLAHTGEEGFYLLHREQFDVVILDVMLPHRDGLEILSTLRGRGNHTPVLLLTAKDAVDDRVRGLDAGADDYMVKPFALSELLARIRALLRRGHAPETPRKLAVADLELDPLARIVTRRGVSLDLTAREFDILEQLVVNHGRVVSREMLAREIWKETARYTPLDNVIDVHVARLRRKIDDPFPDKLIHTVRGVGFILRAGQAA